jgi:hypothetical protein
MNGLADVFESRIEVADRVDAIFPAGNVREPAGTGVVVSLVIIDEYGAYRSGLHVCLA